MSMDKLELNTTGSSISRKKVVPGSGGGALERLDALLAEASHDHLVTDVPMRASFSGRIDSSLVDRYLAGSSSQVKISFSIRFPQRRASAELRTLAQDDAVLRDRSRRPA